MNEAYSQEPNISQHLDLVQMKRHKYEAISILYSEKVKRGMWCACTCTSPFSPSILRGTSHIKITYCWVIMQISETYGQGQSPMPFYVMVAWPRVIEQMEKTPQNNSTHIFRYSHIVCSPSTQDHTTACAREWNYHLLKSWVSRSHV